MLPGIQGFHFDAGHLIFLGAFYTVLTVIAVTVLRAILRTRRDIRNGKESAIRWSADFHELPQRSRSCRHELTGEVAHRECPNAFDCRVCVDHPKYAAAAEASSPEIEVLGVTIPLDRRYHRGHSWVRQESDGTCTVGLDGIAARLLGPGLKPELPATGTKLFVNGPAWTMKSDADRFRILAPLNGTVLETSDGSKGWFLRILPDSGARMTHLLGGVEVEAWMNREVERLEAALPATGVGVALADGGTMVEDPGRSYPKAAWSAATAEFLLQP